MIYSDESEVKTQQTSAAKHSWNTSRLRVFNKQWPEVCTGDADIDDIIKWY